MATKSTPMTTCEICKETTNRRERQPDCGHTLCEPCVIKIKNVHGKIICPTCSNTKEASSSAVTETDKEHYQADKNQKLNGSSDDVDPDTGNSNNERRSKIVKKGALVVGGAGAGGGIAIVGTPVAINAVGFTPGGIAAKTIAAKLMSFTAKVYGAVPKGSIVSFFQRAGALGIDPVRLGIAGAVVGGWAAWKYFGSSETKEDANTNNGEDRTDDNDINDEKKVHEKKTE